MKKAVWGAFLMMTTLAAAGLCEMDYTLSNPHIRYEKIEGARQEETAQADGAGISLSDMAAAEDRLAMCRLVAEDIHRHAGRRHDARLDGRFAQAGGLL